MQVAPTTESIDDQTLNILKQCPRVCGKLTPCHVQNHLILPQDLPLHWEIFACSSWSRGPSTLV